MDKKPKNQDQIAAIQLASDNEAKAVEVSIKHQDVAVVNPELPESPG